MGIHFSKSRNLLSPSEAMARCTPEEWDRLNHFFDTIKNKYDEVDKQTFIYDVLSTINAPSVLSDRLFRLIGGGDSLEKEPFVCALSLLLHGTPEEKIKLIFDIYDVDGRGVLRKDILEQFSRIFCNAMNQNKNASIPLLVSSCLDDIQTDPTGKISFESFREWANNNMTPALISWIFELTPIEFATESPQVQIQPSIWLSRQQSIAQVTGLDNKEISDLQTLYSSVAQQQRYLEISQIKKIFKKEISDNVIEKLFSSFDSDNDGKIDVREFIVALSSCCHGSFEQRCQFCFKTFDVDNDGLLSKDEVMNMICALWRVKDIGVQLAEISDEKEQDVSDVLSQSNCSKLVDSIFQQFDINKDGSISFEEYRTWALTDPIALELINHVRTFSSIHLGIRPNSAREEREIVSGYLSLDHIKTGDSAYLISTPWFYKWSQSLEIHLPIFDSVLSAHNKSENKKEISSSSENLDSSDNWRFIQKQSLGSIDNSGLLDPNSSFKIRQNLLENKDYCIISEQLWVALSKWYGGGPPIMREVISVGTSSFPELLVELYPLAFMCISKSLGRFINLTSSRTARVGSLHSRLSAILRINEKYIRLYDPFENKKKPVLLEDLNATLEDVQLVDGQDLIIEIFKENKWQGLNDEKVSIFEEKVEEKIESGLKGLWNLGNTCFMNAAIQSLCHIPQLTEYFKKDLYIRELNQESKDGMGGKLALQFGLLVKRLYDEITPSPLAPRAFKMTIGKFAPRFASYQQQDAHELLMFVLDGLHEDLNRIHNKPYIQLPDSGGRHFEEVAIEYREAYKKREDSAIVDLLCGELQSTISFQKCGKSSIRFDPYYILTLPLPREKSRYIIIIVIFDDPLRIPVKYVLEINSKKDICLGDLRCRLAEMSGLEWDGIQFMEIFQNKFVKVSDDLSLHRALASDQIFAVEVNSKYRIIMESKEEIKKNSMPEIFIVGTRIDAEDSYHKWYVGIVQKVNEEEKSVFVHFEGWPSKWDEWIKSDSIRLKPLYSQTPVPIPISPLNLKDNIYPLQFLHRRLVPLQHFFIQPYRPVLFGIPIILYLERGKVTSNFLYEAIWKKSQRFAPHPDDVTKSPFLLKLVKRDGLSCSRCTWSKGCLGCILEPNTQIIEYSGDDTIVIDWDEEYYNKYFNLKALKNICNHESVNEKTSSLSAPLSFGDCMKQFTSEEMLKDDSAVYCSKCKEHEIAVKRLELYSTPPILVIHLKRLLQGRKNNTLVQFPHNDFDLTPYITSSKQKGARYDLFSVINHYGFSFGGHYTAFSKIMGRWYLFDDSRVSELEEKEIISNNSYLLFYRRNDLDEKDMTFLPDSVLNQMNKELDADQKQLLLSETDDVKTVCPCPAQSPCIIS